MRNKAVSIRLLAGMVSVLLCNIPLVQASYNPQAAVDYANTWWDGRNIDQYKDYGEVDCANFVSQCLIAGGLDLSSGITDAYGCIISCTNLNNYLVNIGAEHVIWPKGHLPPEPEWFLPGDVAIFGYTDGNGNVHAYAHSVIAVTGDQSNYTTCNGHSTDMYHRSIEEIYQLSASFDDWPFDRCTFYHIPRAFSGAGSGTEQDPYIITNVQELQAMNNHLTAWYQLGNDIDASATSGWHGGDGFIPIGDSSNKFMGHFDGKGHTVTGLYINRPNTDYVGLFGCAYYNEIKDVGLVDIYITGRNYVGGLIGYSGYAGSSMDSRTRCYTTGRVNGKVYVGGLIGLNGRMDISDCYSTASVDGDNGVGGLIGYNAGYSGGTSTSVKISRCYSAGLVNNGVGGDSGVGGLVSGSSQTQWISCYWDIETSGQETSAGGLGKTTMEMKWQVTFTFTGDAWDFETIWNIEEDVSYPFLRVFESDPTIPPPCQIAGSGTQEDPYIIANIKELQAMNNHLTAWYQLGNDIDASATSGWHGGDGFIPIGDSSNKFMGHFDGKGHTVTGLYINRPNTDYVGLFGCAYYNEIKDVGLVDIYITGRNYVGGLIGYSGYAGSSMDSRTRCYTTGRVNGKVYVGGLIGLNGRMDISDCYSTASVDGDNGVGGLIGFNDGYSGGTSTYVKISRCYSAGLVNNGVGGDSGVGGLVSGSRQTQWISCYWDIETSGQETSAGGLGKTTMEMKWQVTFTFTSDPWDFDNVWYIIENLTYPFLRSTPNPAMPVKGIDVSSYQGNIDWSQVYGEGYRFAFARASWWDRSHEDPCFVTNMGNGRSAGMIMGAYHFAYPEYADPCSEALHFLNVAGNYLKGGYLRPALDIENDPASNSYPYRLGKTTLSSWIREWVDTVKSATGVEPIIYTNHDYAKNWFDNSIAEYDLWFAHPYGIDNPPDSEDIVIWDNWDFWQYNWQGSVAGISGDVDLDLFNGDMSALNTFKIPHFWLVFFLCSPADMVVTDPDGLSISKDENQIPGASYGEFDIDEDGDLEDQVRILQKKVGEYHVEVIPEPNAFPTDTYSLKAASNGQTMVLAEDVQIQDIPAQPYEFESKLNRSDFDTDGDVDMNDLAALSLYWLEQDCNYPDWCQGTDLNYNGFVDFIDFATFADNWLWEKIIADIDINGDVDLADYAILANQWRQPPAFPSADIAPEIPDGVVDMLDLAVLAEHWLEGVEPEL